MLPRYVCGFFVGTVQPNIIAGVTPIRSPEDRPETIAYPRSLTAEAGEEDVLIRPGTAYGSDDAPAVGPGEVQDVTTARRGDRGFDVDVIPHIGRSQKRVTRRPDRRSR